MLFTRQCLFLIFKDQIKWVLMNKCDQRPKIYVWPAVLNSVIRAVILQLIQSGLTWLVQTRAPLCFLHCRGYSKVCPAHLIAPVQTSFLKNTRKYCHSCAPIMQKHIKLDCNKCRNMCKHDHSLQGKTRLVLGTTCVRTNKSNTNL